MNSTQDSNMGLSTSWLRSGKKRNITNPSNKHTASEVATPVGKRVRSGIPLRESRTHLLNMPREIRDEINQYLLLNPILGKGSSVTMLEHPIQNGERAITSPKYDLHPVVLRVCKQMYYEGFHMLYERNVFFMDCTNWIYRDFELWDDHMDPVYAYHSTLTAGRFPSTTALNVCPLTRYSKHLNVSPTNTSWSYQGDQFFLEQPTLRRLIGPQASYVKKWKIVVNGDAGRRVHKSSEENKKTLGRDFEKHLDFQEIFSCLKVLRNVKKVEFREAHADVEDDEEGEQISEEFPGYFDEIYRVVDNSATTLTSGELQDKYMSLMKGSSPLVDPLHLMCDDLVAYAKTFELVPEFRRHMDVATVLNEILSYRDANNPPASEVLRKARASAVFDDINQFKVYRKELLLNSEEQWRKINERLTGLHDFVKKDKIFRGILCSESYIHQIDELDLDEYTRASRNLKNSVIKGLTLLEDCVTSFTRDALISCDYSAFLQCFKEVVEDMYAQHSEIREARKKLFRWDTGPPVRWIDINNGKFEVIVWDELEPVEWSIFIEDPPYLGPL